MSTKTSNFEYIKPGEDEFYNITEFNQTLDKIDADMKALKDTGCSTAGSPVIRRSHGKAQR